MVFRTSGLGFRVQGFTVLVGYCPPLSNSWIMTILRLYITLNRTP